MPSNMDFLRSQVASNAIQVAANAWSCAVAATTDELCVAKSGMLFWKKNLERYPLSEVAEVTRRPNSNADIVSIVLRDGRVLSLMFDERAERECAARLVDYLTASIRDTHGAEV